MFESNINHIHSSRASSREGGETCSRSQTRQSRLLLNFAHFEHFRQMFCAFFSAKAVFKNKSDVISLESIFTK
ncbi:unnamed protein product [Hapterophycus canaliculatus]